MTPHAHSASRCPEGFGVSRSSSLLRSGVSRFVASVVSGLVARRVAFASVARRPRTWLTSVPQSRTVNRVSPHSSDATWRVWPPKPVSGWAAPEGAEPWSSLALAAPLTVGCLPRYPSVRSHRSVPRARAVVIGYASGVARQAKACALGVFPVGSWPLRGLTSPSRGRAAMKPRRAPQVKRWALRRS